jgi:hypothetical protein
MPVVFHRYVANMFLMDHEFLMVPELCVMMLMVPVMFNRFAKLLYGNISKKSRMFMLPVARVLNRLPERPGI